MGKLTKCKNKKELAYVIKSMRDYYIANYDLKYGYDRGMVRAFTSVLEMMGLE